jgi:hypothetical protein
MKFMNEEWKESRELKNFGLHSEIIPDEIRKLRQKAKPAEQANKKGPGKKQFPNRTLPKISGGASQTPAATTNKNTASRQTRKTPNQEAQKSNNRQKRKR